MAKNEHKWKRRSSGIYECSRCNFAIIIKFSANTYLASCKKNKDHKLTPMSNIYTESLDSPVAARIPLYRNGHFFTSGTMWASQVAIINEDLIFDFCDCKTCRVIGMCS